MPIMLVTAPERVVASINPRSFMIVRLITSPRDIMAPPRMISPITCLHCSRAAINPLGSSTGDSTKVMAHTRRKENIYSIKAIPVMG